ncbi:MAG: ABC transporter ATP-binding protein [Acidimicrobiia bacterium]|nr:ABC transporter ATP-binding protein [Acidimicrobiia bacterium]
MSTEARSRPAHIVCEQCGELYTVKSRGVIPRFCSPECRVKRNLKSADLDPYPPQLKLGLADNEEPVVQRSAAAANAATNGSEDVQFGKPEVAERTDVQNSQSDLQILRRVFREARPFRGRISVLMLVSLLSTPLALLVPVPLAIAVDGVLGAEPLPKFLAPIVPDWVEASSFRVLVLAAGMQVVVVLLIQLQSVVKTVLETSTGQKLTLRFQSKLLEHAQRLSFAFHDRRGTADSIYRIQYDATAVRNIAVHSLMPFLSAGFTFFAMLYIVLRIDWQLAAVAMAISPLLFVYARLYRLRMRPQYRDAKKLESSALKVVQEVLTSFRVVKAFGREQHERRRFVDTSALGVTARVQLAISEGIFALLINVTTALGTALVIFIGIRNVQSGVLTLGSLLLVLTYISQLYGPLQTVSRRIASLQSSMASAQRAFELLDVAPDVTDRPGAAVIDRARGELELLNVSFSYDGAAQVLRDVSLRVTAGSRIGIAGPTGAGKTTLVSLLSRFYDPTDGSILLDGVDLRDYRLKDLRRQFAIMLQEPLLLSASIADNIAYARPEASFDEIEAAAKAAGAHRFISELPEGYSTSVDERGNRLSGGERQRISLARAFLKDAPILILDEPTSSVDVETEAGIMQAMERLMKGRTTIMIAHRLSTLDGCDFMVEMSGGIARLHTSEVAAP